MRLITSVLFSLLPALTIAQSFERDRSVESRESKANTGSIDEQLSVKQLFWPYLLDVAKRGAAALQDVSDKDATQEYLRARDAMATFIANPEYDCWSVYSGSRYAYGESLILGGEPKDAGCPEYAKKVLRNCYVYEPIPMATAEIPPNGPITVLYQGRHGRPIFPAYSLTCVSTAAEVVAVATRIVAQSSVSVRDPRSGNQLIVTEDLRRKAKVAFARGLALTFQNTNFSPAKITTRSCRVPTSTGLDSNNGLLKCGDLEFDQLSQSYRRGGVLILDEQTLNGVKITFANSTKSDKTRGQSTTDRRKAKIEQ